MKNEKKQLKDFEVNVKIKIAALWAVIMILYIYNDIYSLFKPGTLESMLAGKMGPFDVSQVGLFSGAVLMAIPAMMIFLSLVIKPQPNRILNIIVSFVYIGVMVASLINEWYFYILMGVLEIACNVLIIILSARWPKMNV